MISIKLKFKAQADATKPGALYFQIIHDRTVRQMRTGYRIYACEWNRQRGEIVCASPFPDARSVELKTIRDKTAWERQRLEHIARSLEHSGRPCTAEDVIRCYRQASRPDETTVFAYMHLQSERMKKLGKTRTSETYQQALRSFMKFRNGADLYFDMLDADMVDQYERFMRARGLSRNTTSFYMRILRCMYNRAAEDGLAQQTDPFKRVYTGVDKTAKRAVAIKEMRRIKELNLADRPDLDFARDIFLFSFYMRGMSFIDLAYLQKKDLANGYITYIRKKTGQRLSVRWERSMQEILEKYPENPTPYLLPIITRQDGTERRQYLNKMLFVNRKLKQIARLANIEMPLSMYVSRHSWASIAKSKNVPLSVISEGMGHDNEETTRIYLTTIQTHRIDDANRRILKEL